MVHNSFKMKRLYILLMLLTVASHLSAQKDCSRDSIGLVPLSDLQSGFYRGYKGGFYDGTNTRPVSHSNDLKNEINKISPLDKDGNPASNGAIVFIGVGASNPRTEFDTFMAMANKRPDLNPNLKLINTCIGGQGIQKMNQSSDNYWTQTYKLIEDSLGYNRKQVQLAWIETENTQTGDTLFPRAPLSLVDDYRVLMQTLLQNFPNLKICYVSSRAYARFTADTGGVGKGLLFPRDYYSGFAIKWMVDSAIHHSPGFEFAGAGRKAPLVTWGSYHWSDGSRKRSDGFYLDCATDLGGDGLHLSEAGENKIGQLMLTFFATDSLAKLWFLKSGSTAITEAIPAAELNAYPNPAQETLHISLPFSEYEGTLSLFNSKGEKVVEQVVNERKSSLNVSQLAVGLYMLQFRSEAECYHSKVMLSR